MVRLTSSSDSVLMGHRMVRQPEKGFLFRGAFLKDLLERTCDDEKLRLVATEAEIFLLGGQYALFRMVCSV
jgi:hypothetical protein